MFWRREWLHLFCYYQEKAKQQGTIRGVIKQVASEFSWEGRWEVTEVWSECGRNVSWWLIAWFKFHGAPHPLWRPSFYTASLIPGECHCHSEAASVTRGPSQAKQHFLEAGDSFIKPFPPVACSVFPYHQGCQASCLQGINISGCLPTSAEIRWPLWKATPEASACQRDARNSESLWCADLTEWAPMQLAWVRKLVPLPDVVPLIIPGSPDARCPAQLPLSVDSGVRRAGLETQPRDQLAAWL